jgi:putative redox protein
LTLKHARISWIEDLDFEARSEDGASVLLRGRDRSSGFSPASLLLTALAGCTAMDTISILTKKRQLIEAYEVDVEGEQRDGHPRLYTTIRINHLITGIDVEDAAVARSIELSATKYCVVSATIASGDTRIEHHYRITDAAGTRAAAGVVIGPQGSGLVHS